MWLENEILAEDMQLVAESNAVDWNMLRNSSILVTGATGMIGQNLINSLLFASAQKGLHIRVLALVRDRQRAEEIYEGVRRTGENIYRDDERGFRRSKRQAYQDEKAADN